ncbi:MAG: HAMP domain-containing sensor histidine kinase [Bacteroidota bacterium]
MQNSRLRLLSYVVIAYMLMAFAWWSVLLFQKNQNAFDAQRELLEWQLASEQKFNGTATERFAILLSQMEELRAANRRQEWMITSEAIVFVIILITGIYLIDRGYRKEVESARQKRNFLLSITHELKSPIASIQLVLETFLKRDLKRPAITKFSQSALKETKRLYNLVNNLLLSAKLEEAYQINTEEVDVSLLVNDLVAELEEKYPEAQFEVEEETDLPNLQGDLSGLTSVFLNLLENAIKYSKEAAQIHVKLQQAGKYAEIAISDQGIGISNKEKKMVFQKFYRVGSEDTRSTKGTGLGLYIVREIIRAHNGTIRILDNKPRGTIMSLRLPVEGVKESTTRKLSLQT